MDPQATWDRLLDAVSERNWERAEKLAKSLLHWLGRRRDPPQTMDHKGLPRGWHAAIAQFVGYMTLNSVCDSRRQAKRKKKMK